MTKAVPISEFRSLPLLASFFPLWFDNGARWDEISANCSGCGETAESSDLRGTAAFTPCGWDVKLATPYRSMPMPGCYVIKGLSYCRACDTLTPVELRLHADMSLSGPVPGGRGEWGHWAARRPWHSPITKPLRKMFRTITTRLRRRGSP